MSNKPDQARASPWHAGELEIQRQAGVVELMDGPGRLAVRDHLIEQHRNFYPLLPFVVLGAVDPRGDAWATLRAGQPGFVHARDERHLHLQVDPVPADPAEVGLANGAAVGLLGIDLATRRRNRLNGRLRRSQDSGFDIEVQQSFGNCPKYIVQRDFALRQAETPDPVRPRLLPQLDAPARRLILAADTFFVASYADRDGGREVDVSHRGGRRGFVKIDEAGSLHIPDFSGNRFFNTLGNLILNHRAGLVFVDFDNGDLLQMTGRAEVVLDSAEVQAFQGAERFWNFAPTSIVLRPGALPLRWTPRPDGASPASSSTGVWREAQGNRI